MKLLVSADIEGTCGICHWDETMKNHPDYGYFAQQMTREVTSVCKGALTDGIVDEILIKDAHDSARNLIPSMLPEEAEIIRGWEGAPGGMVAGIKENIDAVAMTGYHSGAYTTGNPLSHTSNRENQFVHINGMTASEFLINTYTCAYYGVPVVFLSGDQGLCDSAKALIPDIETVAVSESFGAASKSIHPDKAVRLMEEGMKRALQKDMKKCLVTLPEHFHVEIEFKEYARAQKGSFFPGVKREGTKGVSFDSDDYYEILRFFFFVL